MALTIVNDALTTGTHIEFHFIGLSESAKTCKFEVVAKEGRMLLGYVEWFGQWRKYAFRPLSMTFYEETCLNEIADFVKGKTTEHRQALRAAKGAKV